MSNQTPPVAAGWPQTPHGQQAEDERQAREAAPVECWPPAQPTNVEDKSPRAMVSEVPPVDNTFWPAPVESIQQNKGPAVNGTPTDAPDPRFFNPFIEVAPGYAPARNGVVIPEHREIPPLATNHDGPDPTEGFLQRQQRERDAALNRKRR